MIQIDQVTRVFKEKKKTVTAVNNVSFSIEKGEVIGLLGENGAGKTTLLRMIAGILEPTSGGISINNLDVQKNPTEIKKTIGVLFGSETGLYDRLTARENLQYFARLYGLSRHHTENQIELLATRFGMKDYLDRRVGGFSKGMRQKVAIARTLIHDPQVILLDEPTTGLDITSANMFREFIHHLQNEGKTIIFSSHIMEEVQQLCEAIVMIHKGNVVYNGTLQNLYKEEETDNLNYIFMSKIVRGNSID
ncbi:ATP-binding cassette domain-containing protein [Aquibacillus kalidii]|uniref:ATP-binding cassette domain-containing protein n=1 Tax=Aquibacillus kalidii TaxID=2762597 RepID=UPI001648D410|nr:ATP-binding cassette domain-containing protein [Aquibacillus kalidii]